jgi:DNA-binding NarL/FixJ family response regulator
MTPISVLLVDDNPDFLKSAADLLALQPEYCVVGQAMSGEDALVQIERLSPQLVLIDWAMPVMSGVQTTRLIKTRDKAPRVVIITLYDQMQYRSAALAAGADGFISKVDWMTQLTPLARQMFAEV